MSPSSPAARKGADSQRFQTKGQEGCAGGASLGKGRVMSSVSQKKWAPAGNDGRLCD